MHLLESHIDNLDFDNITLTECWAQIDFCIPYIEGYNYMDSPNVSGKSGGDILYYKSSLKCQNVDVSHLICKNSDTEAIKANFPKCNSIVVLIYRHPTSNVNGFLESMENILDLELLNRDSKVIICGDFNIDLLKTGLKTEVYKNLIKSFNLKFCFTPSHRFVVFMH